MVDHFASKDLSCLSFWNRALKGHDNLDKCHLSINFMCHLHCNSPPCSVSLVEDGVPGGREGGPPRRRWSHGRPEVRDAGQLLQDRIAFWEAVRGENVLERTRGTKELRHRYTGDPGWAPGISVFSTHFFRFLLLLGLTVPNHPAKQQGLSCALSGPYTQTCQHSSLSHGDIQSLSPWQGSCSQESICEQGVS